MLSEGDAAPDFSLYGINADDRDTYMLSEATAEGNAAVLLFYPFDFSPVCTAELCDIRDMGWANAADDVLVWGISSDSTYAHRAFAEAYDIDYPLLSDQRGEVAERYGVRYDWWDGHVDVPQRAAFVINADQDVAYAWRTYNAYESADLAPIGRIIEALSEDESISASALDERSKTGEQSQRVERFDD